MKHKCPLCGEASERGLAAEQLLADLREAGEAMRLLLLLAAPTSNISKRWGASLAAIDTAKEKP